MCRSLVLTGCDFSKLEGLHGNGTITTLCSSILDIDPVNTIVQVRLTTELTANPLAVDVSSKV